MRSGKPAVMMLLIVALIMLIPIAGMNPYLDDTGSYYYQGNSAVRVEYPNLISDLSPRNFADYLWDYHAQEMVDRGWASTNDMMEANSNPYPQYKPTPFTLYQAIFNDTNMAAQLSESSEFRWGISMACPVISPTNQKYCTDVSQGSYGILPAGTYWNVTQLSSVMMSMAATGYTQAEIALASINAGYDPSLTMRSLMYTNVNENAHYTSIQDRDVDPAIYGSNPYVMTIPDIPPYALISTGAPLGPINTQNQAPNPHFGGLALNWNDALVWCGKDNGDASYASAACWRGEVPTYFIIPSNVTQQLDRKILDFVASTTMRLLYGALIVPNLADVVNGYGPISGDSNLCRSQQNDMGCLTLDQYRTYYNDLQKIAPLITNWEQQHHLDLMWTGVPIETGISSWVSESQIPNPYSATWTVAFHHPEVLPSPDIVSQEIQDKPGQLQPNPQAYALLLYQWLQHYSFIRDYSATCSENNNCEPTAMLKAMRSFILVENVTSQSQLDQAIQQGEQGQHALDSYGLTHYAQLLGARISYLWKGCEGTCIFGQDTKSQNELTNIMKLAYSTFEQDIQNNGNGQIFNSQFFHDAIGPLSRTMLLLGSTYWNMMTSTFQQCLTSCDLQVNLPVEQNITSPQNMPAISRPPTITIQAPKPVNTTITVTVTETTNTTTSPLTPTTFQNGFTPPDSYYSYTWFLPVIIAALAILLGFQTVRGKLEKKPKVAQFKPRIDIVIHSTDPQTVKDHLRSIRKLNATHTSLKQKTNTSTTFDYYPRDEKNLSDAT